MHKYWNIYVRIYDMIVMRHFGNFRKDFDSEKLLKNCGKI